MGPEVVSHFGLSSVHAAPLADAGLLFVFLIAAGVTAMTFVGFTFWVIYHIVRILVLLGARMLLLPRRTCSSKQILTNTDAWHVCPDPVCRTVNPQHAHYCRQCGRMIRKPERLAA